jgi:hypothetical protein
MLFSLLDGANAKPHDRVTVNASHALYRANAGAFGQCADYADLLVDAEYVYHEY